MKLKDLEKVRSLGSLYLQQRKNMAVLQRVQDMPNAHETILRVKAVLRHERPGMEPIEVDLFTPEDLTGGFSETLLSQAIARARTRVTETVMQLNKLGVGVTEDDGAEAIEAAERMLSRYPR